MCGRQQWGRNQGAGVWGGVELLSSWDRKKKLHIFRGRMIARPGDTNEVTTAHYSVCSPQSIPMVVFVAAPWGLGGFIRDLCETKREKHGWQEVKDFPQWPLQKKTSEHGHLQTLVHPPSPLMGSSQYLKKNCLPLFYQGQGEKGPRYKQRDCEVTDTCLPSPHSLLAV